MANLPAALIANVELRWTLQNQQCENTFHVSGAAPWNDASLLAINTLLTGWIASDYKTKVTTAILFTEIQSTGLDTVDGPQVTTSVNQPGTITGGTLPNETSFCVSLRSGLTGRSRRGRWYMPPPLLSQTTDNNTVDVAYANAVSGALFNLMGLFVAADMRMGVLSRVLNGAQRTPPLFTGYTNATYTNLILDSMRSRRPGNGS